MECNVVTCTIDDFNYKSISISNFQSWPWKLSIDRNYVVTTAQPLHGRCLNLLHTWLLVRQENIVAEHEKLRIRRSSRHTTNSWKCISAFAVEKAKLSARKKLRNLKGSIPLVGSILKKLVIWVCHLYWTSVCKLCLGQLRHQ